MCDCECNDTNRYIQAQTRVKFYAHLVPRIKIIKLVLNTKFNALVITELKMHTIKLLY